MTWVMLFTGLLLGWIIEWIFDTYRYNRMVKQTQSEHSGAITEMVDHYEDIIEQIQWRHEDKLNELQEDHRYKLSSTETKFNTRLTEQAATHRRELDANQRHAQGELQLIEVQRRSELNACSATYTQAKEVLKQGYDQKLAQLKTEHEQSLRQIALRLRAQHEAEHEQQRIFLHEAHMKDLNNFKTRIHSEHENNISNTKHNGAITLQHDELTLLSRLQTNTTPEDASTIVSSSLMSSSHAPSINSGHAISHIQADDLTIIQGIGPKANNLLHDAGIKSYHDLAHTDVGTLKNILDNAGSRFRLLTPDTWPQQASLAAGKEAKTH